MDKASLVESTEIEGQVVEALSRAQMPVTAVDWMWVPQYETSRLVVVTTLHDKKGPRETYGRILEALAKANVNRRVPLGELFAIGPEDPLAQELVRQLRSNTEGTIHVVKIRENGRSRFSVVLTPYVGKGGAIPSVKVKGETELRSFLAKQLRIPQYSVDQAVSQLERTDNASIPNVRLNLRRAKKLKLAA